MSESTWFGRLPANWRVRCLKYLAHLCTSRADARPDGQTYIGLENIESWTGRLVEGDSVEPGDDTGPQSQSASGSFTAGDVLFGKLRPYLAKAWLADRDGVCTTELLILQPNAELEPRFLLFALLCPQFIHLVDSSTFGARMPRANWDFIGSLPIPLPCRATQRRIVDHIGRETVRIDALIAEKRRMLALLEEKRSALVSRVVTRGLDPDVPLKPSGLEWLGEIPAHWQIWRLKFMAEVRGGLTIGRDYGSRELREYPYLRVANVQDGRIDLRDVATVLVPESEAKGCLLQPGDVLMNEGGDPDKLGRGSVWRGEIDPCLHQNHVFCVRPRTIEPEWLDIWTTTVEAKSYFESRGKQTTNLASISSTNIRELSVPIPPKEERAAILAAIRNEQKHSAAMEQVLHASLALLNERRSALITAAVTGRLTSEVVNGRERVSLAAPSSA